MFDHTHVCIYVHTSTHTRYQGTADSAVHKSTGTVSAFLGHRQCSVPKGTHTYTHTYGHTFTHGRTHTHTKAGIPLAQLNWLWTHTHAHTHTKEQYNKRCLTTHMYVYMYVQAHTPDTRELQTVLFTKAQALFRPFWAIVSAVYPKEHTHTHTRTDTHSRTDAHTRTLRQEFHLHNLIGYGHTRTHTHTQRSSITRDV